mgnify:FL=1
MNKNPEKPLDKSSSRTYHRQYNLNIKIFETKNKIRQGQSMKARIAGIGAYAPERVVTNDQLSEIVDTSDEWIRSRTGI